MEENALREIKEETGQDVDSLQYICSYFFKPRNLVMAGFAAHVHSVPFGASREVDAIMWCDINQANAFLLRENNLSGMHFDRTVEFLK